MNDYEIVKKLRQIENCLQKSRDLINEIGESDHPNAQELYDALLNECYSAASAEAVGSHYLEHPERYVLRYGAYLYGVNSKMAKREIQRV